jgi:hypothetical protein
MYFQHTRDNGAEEEADGDYVSYEMNTVLTCTIPTNAEDTAMEPKIRNEM